MKSTKRAKKKVAGSRKQQGEVTTTAIHVQDGAGHVVGIGNLRVMLVDDDGSWFAQGLEIDYFAQGSSIEEAQRRFQEGLRETLDYHLKLFGTIVGVLRVAPKEVWDEFYGEQSGPRKMYSQISVHFDDNQLAELLPFEAIDFYGKGEAAA